MGWNHYQIVQLPQLYEIKCTRSEKSVFFVLIPFNLDIKQVFGAGYNINAKLR